MSDPALHALAGAVGGMVAMSVTYPLVVLSTRAAVDSKHDNKVTLDIIKREGFRGLYSGLSSSLVGIAVTNGRALSTAESILAGLIAGSATTIISNPIWVVQTSQAVHSTNANASDTSASRPQKLGIFEAIEKILSKDGPAGFWRGIGPALALVINPVIQYTVFEQLKNLLTERRMARLPKGRQGSALAMLTDWDFFVLGAFSKLGNVVKSRLQAGHVQSERYKSTLRGLLTIFKEEGLQGLYGGAKSKLLQSVLTAAILFTAQRRIYELTNKTVSSLKNSRVR
ncbi:peroxisomal membrane protein PMP47B [Boletus edulis]|nr:peroxisomal membrane protein PMP47B [Boletus edulis]